MMVIEYSGLDVHAVRGLGNRLELSRIQEISPT